ncbi:MAG: GspMb/PilO family protein [Yoonia sp.]|uniref:GspMb/PilO family protein n=1 Tax=Yoonia sp. TaxID=2212373 RepID=UPI00273F81C4|nr:GspMb/PilO family protein [Yoonia sp.]MDP5086686.1 GspMb/PilO family protein [Yoonia sp.]MDP5359958.1 GspMb/PilO family protein [Paracoccaceae bacterium]
MSSFAFYNPTLVRRVGTLLVMGTSILLILLTLFLANVARNNYDDIALEQETILRAQRATTEQVAPDVLSKFYSADTPQLAQSQMQTEMQALAQQNQVRLEVIRADQIEQLSGALRMGLTLNGVVSESQLGGFLESLTAHEPKIVVESVSLRRARATNQTVDDRPLAIELKLSGFTR